MKLRKSLALLLTLALTLGIVPIADATGTVEGQSTTYESVGTVTQSLSDSSESTDGAPDLIVDSTNEPGNLPVDTIHVTITNIYTIQVNPYGMTIEKPDNSGTSTESIVTAPMRIENSSGVKMEVTATATATPKGDVALVSEPTRKPPDPYEDPNQYPSKKRIYLYMEMTGYDKEGKTHITTDRSVITKEGGSDPLKVYIAKNTDKDTPTSATLEIKGETSLPTDYYSWHRGNGVNVTVVLSFMPIQDEPGYSVSFDAKDVFPNDALAYDIQILVDGETPQTLEFEKGYKSTGSPQVVTAKKNLTFTIKTAEEATGSFYAIRKIFLYRGDGTELVDEKMPYNWQTGDPKLAQFTYTINAANVDPDEHLRVEVVLNKVTIN